MSFPSELPPELIGAVIDELRDDSIALARCSLVSYQFLARSQTHLYARITIEFDRQGYLQPHPVQRFLQVLTPHLARCIHYLTLLNYVEHDWNSSLDGTASDCGDQFLALLFHQLGRLHSFTLIVAPHGGAFRNRHLSDSLTSIIYTMIQVTRVSELIIDNTIDFPTIFLAFDCPYLRKLSFHQRLGGLRSVGEQDAVIIPSHAETQDIDHLDSLEFDDASVINIESLYSNMKLSRSRLTLSYLRELSVLGHEPSTVSLVAKIVSDTWTMLECLNWDYDQSYRYTDFRSESMALAFPPNPVSLRLAFPHDSHKAEPTHLNWLLNGLQRTPGSSKRLEELVIVLNFGYSPNDNINPNLWSECDVWAPAFDALLSGPQYPHLRRVSVFIDCDPPDDGHDLVVSYFANEAEQFRHKLPMLRDSGKLSVQWMMLVGYPIWPLSFALRAMKRGLEGGIIVDQEGEFVVE